MRKDYKTLNTLTLKQKKDYLLSIDYQRATQEKIYECMSEKQLGTLLTQKDVSHRLLMAALKELYNSQNYDELEFHIIMINHLFDSEKYQQIKQQLLTKLCKKSITINEYCVMRQLVNFQNISFAQFITHLHDTLDVENEECARICLLEDQHHLAYEYLKQLDDCHDQKLLDLLCSYSILEYTSLIKCYAKKKRGYTLIPTH